MSPARCIEYRITRKLVQGGPAPAALGLAERTIAITALTVVLLLLGSLAPGLVIAALAASALLSFSF